MACSFLYAHQAPLLDARTSLLQQDVYTQSFSRTSSNGSTSTVHPVFTGHPTHALQPHNNYHHRLSNSTEHTNQGWQTARSSSLPLLAGGPSPMHTAPHHLWIPQSNSTHPELYTPHPPAASRTKSWPAPQYNHHYCQQPPTNYGNMATLKPHSHSHSSSYGGESKAHRRSSSQQQQLYPTTGSSATLSGRTSPSSATSSRSSSTISVFSSPPTSPFPYADMPSSASSSGSGNTSASGNGTMGALTPVHQAYAGLARTESGLIAIPPRYAFTRGEIVMTRTTRRLMKTSSTSRLTARHPCLILQLSPTHTHVRVLQMTSHVHLMEDQVRVVGAQLRHWLAREDEGHRDAFGRVGLQTCPPSNRAGYIWVGDGGEWVPVESVKYLTGTRVDEREVQRLESFITEHEVYIPFRPSGDTSK